LQGKAKERFDEMLRLYNKADRLLAGFFALIKGSDVVSFWDEDPLR